ncbi:MAG: DUF4387 domain-containing protein [Clostridia bacterium]|nr:DUF4387 domain-containing protein [Clostridia bacterium]
MGQKYPLTQLAEVIRSKNAGPFELTLDIIFKEQATYEKVKADRAVTRELVAGLYKIPVEKIIALVEFDPARAIKITMERPRPAGELGETDVYGAQQHGPLLALEIELADES